MKKIQQITLFLLFTSLGVLHLSAQSEQESTRDFGYNKMLLTGRTTISAVVDTGTATFGDAIFSAILLYQLSDKLFVESELEVGTGDGEVKINLEHANMVWMIHPNIAFHAGRFIPHFGLFRGRLAEGFVNRFPSNPTGFGDGGIGPLIETGFGFQGGFPLGSAKMNYDLWVGNGPQLLHNSLEDVGTFEFEAFFDNNKNKDIGGRIGLLPFSNSSLELGFSYEAASKTGDQNSREQNVGVNMMAIDANYFHRISPLKSTLRVALEYKTQDVSNYTYEVESLPVSFTNKSNAWYGMFSLRPSLVDNKVFRNLELAFRYSQFNRPENAPWGGGSGHVNTRTTYALDYWLKWNCVAKIAYQQEKGLADQFLAQLVYGF